MIYFMLLFRLFIFRIGIHHQTKPISKKYYQSWIDCFHLRLSFFSRGFFRFFSWDEIFLKQQNNEKKISRIMTKAIFFCVLCIKMFIQRSTNTLAQTLTHTHRSPRSFFLLPARLFSFSSDSSVENFMHLVFDLRRIDGFAPLLGLFCYHRPNISFRLFLGIDHWEEPNGKMLWLENLQAQPQTKPVADLISKFTWKYFAELYNQDFS